MTLSIVPLLACAGAASGQQGSGALDSMVATERLFAATSIKEGIRASFLQFFADSCVAFNPAPYVYKQAVVKSPPQADPLRWILSWEPVTGDVSRSADLGYTMGPSTLRDQRSPDSTVHYGFYFSIWRRQPNDTWKVILDIGTEVTERIMRFWGAGFTPWRPADNEPSGAEPASSPVTVDLRVQDSLFSVLAARTSVQEAYAAVLDEHARAIREDVGPIVGRDSILAFVALGRERLVLQPIGFGISRAGDLGYTYGTYSPTPAPPEPAGYYVRVWKENAAGKWKLVVDKTSPRERD